MIYEHLFLGNINVDDQEKLSKSGLYDLYKFCDNAIHDIKIKCNNRYFGPLGSEFVEKDDEACKFWEKAYKILENSNICNNINNIHPKKCCEYFNYWLYGMFKDRDIYDNIYKAWDSFFYKLPRKKTCYIKNKYITFNKGQFEMKKRLFDFLELYYLLKDKLSDDNNKKECCDYINDMFKLYKEMENTSNKQIYKDEIFHFRSKFHGNYSELNFLNNKCPNKCLHLVFNSYNKTLCPFENEKSGIYGEMNEKIEEGNYYDICSNFLSNNNEHCDNYMLCIMIARNLINLSKLNKNERIKKCHYFIHWLYDKVGKIYGNSMNTIQDKITVNKIFNVSYMILQKLGINDCYFDVISLDLVQNKERKYLHDYFENYKNIESKTCDNNNNCQQYCERIMKINELYKKYIEKCCTYYSKDDYSDDCKYYFKCNQNYNPYNLYKKLKCYEVIPSDNEKMEEVKITLVKDYVQQLINDYRNKLKLMINGNTSGSLCEGFICDTFYMPVLLLFGLLGILLISFIVYKVNIN
ncbi:hypothetical protein PVIIG_02358 [Plasmodium vivax India VII]|uniref:Variable surface protein Vir24g n=1 Tax=Plasmodium vivax India VII TaxID=1077284 RepID=A0A0J9SHS9_PLAVI|nr:hypothetical protein PVIIG_02358 [Plasmodium vivax India VII]